MPIHSAGAAWGEPGPGADGGDDLGHHRQCHRCGQRCAQQTGGGDDPMRGLDGRRVHVESNERAADHGKDDRGKDGEGRRRIAAIHNEIHKLIKPCEYVFLIEDDGALPPDALSRLLADYKAHPYAGFIEGVELGRWGSHNRSVAS